MTTKTEELGVLREGILILYSTADALYGPRKRKMRDETKLKEFFRLLPRMSVEQRRRVVSAAVACGIEDFEATRNGVTPCVSRRK